MENIEMDTSLIILIVLMCYHKAQAHSLPSVCNADVKRLCGPPTPSSVFQPAAINCFESLKHELSPMCRRWHKQRMQCNDQLATLHVRHPECEVCRDHCRLKSNLHCMRVLGRRISDLVDAGCYDTDFARSILELVKN